MSQHNPLRRGLALLAAGVLGAGGLTAVGTAVGAGSAAAASTPISEATLTWGLSGYAQRGIFGPWTFKDLTGGATQLRGSVSGGSQSDYTVAPVPATSMPASSPQRTPNAVRFGAGTGAVDPVTGAGTLAWDGSYTVNAYPAAFGAPDEIYSDPVLTTAADGSGTLTMELALGAGTDMEGNPVPAQSLGRLPVATFDAGSSAATSDDSWRLTPDYQGVRVSVPSDSGPQVVSCAASEGVTGWWGSWPQELVSALPGSVRPHFYSTGCGGMQDNKPPLPVDVDLGLPAAADPGPAVTVSQTTLPAQGATQITVTGTGFDDASVVGTRPPLMGQPSGLYVVLGRFADVWRPSAGAPGSSRVVGTQRWAVPAAQMAAIGGASAGAVELLPDGSFTTTLTVDKAALDARAGTGTYGVFTYAGGGAVAASYETATPLTFTVPPVVPPVVPPTTPPTTPPTIPPTTPPTSQVASAPVEVALSLRGRVETGERTPVTVDLGAGTTGEVRVVLRRVRGEQPSGSAVSAAGARKNPPLKSVTKSLRDGRATVVLPRLERGRYKLVVVPMQARAERAVHTFRAR